MLLVLTHSQDFTTDCVLDRLDDIDVFRFNMDLWKDYQWEVNQNTFTLSDPMNRICREEETHAVYLRKLFFNPPVIDLPAGGSEESWTRGEVEELWLGIRDLAMETGRLALIHPSPRGRWSKIRQMRVASRFFRVPDWSAYRADSCPLAGSIVAKSFGQRHLGEGSLLMVREVDGTKLSPKFPWLVQQRVPATHDVTVACVGREIFAYELSRDLFEGEDCRYPTTLQDLRWTPCSLTATETAAIQGFMEATGYTFGRLDFLRDADGLWFLEINPNGQFAWLDPDGEHGLIDAVADAIRSVHRRHQSAAHSLA